jgi:hypothetical protein
MTKLEEQRPQTSRRDDVATSNALDADERALAVHEAGHAVVARALGADVVFVEIDVGTGNGGSRSGVFADNIKNLKANADVVSRIADALFCAEVRRQSAHRRRRAGCAARRSWFSLRAGRAALGSPCRTRRPSRRRGRQEDDTMT